MSRFSRKSRRNSATRVLQWRSHDAPRGGCDLTCMDARLDPAKFAGLSEGDAM